MLVRKKHTNTHCVHAEECREELGVSPSGWQREREQVRERPRKRAEESKREAARLLSHHTLLTQSRPPLPYTPSYPHTNTHTRTHYTKLNTYHPLHKLHAQTHIHVPKPQSCGRSTSLKLTLNSKYL